jgi:ribosome-associated heat shock protein Hsp15
MTEESIRLDKWLWQARFFKTRALASKICAAGRVRIDGEKVTKAHAAIRPGHVLTFPQARDIRVVRVIALGTRRGPAVEAQTLYDDLVADGEPASKYSRGQKANP